MASAIARGVLFVHSAPSSLCRHLERTISATLGHTVSLVWEEQPVLQGTFRAELSWRGPRGAGSVLAGALRGWEHVRFEVTEEASPGFDGARFMHTPDLGVFYGAMDSAGNTVVTEDRLKAALEQGRGDFRVIEKELRLAWGAAWDDELEPFRYAGEDTGLIWFHQVG